MNIVAIGINHKNTPIEIREKFYLSSTEQDFLLCELKSNPSIIEAFTLSTCNRVEVYIHVLDLDMDLLPVIKLIFEIKKIPFNEKLKKYFYKFYAEDAVDHLLRVAAGLDSMVLGEKQILGQIKSAFERARDRGMFGKNFNILSNLALRTGKKARNETNICLGGSSVSWAAITMAEKKLGSFDGKSILLIGAGKMGALTSGQLQNKKFKHLYFMNNTQAKAQALAEKYNGEAVAFCDMKEILTKVDISVCAVDAPHYILEKNTVQKIIPLRGSRPLLLIDISMPRNIEPEISEIELVSLFAIDDLKEVVDSNMKLRHEAVKDVEKIINTKISEYSSKIKPALNRQAQKIVPTV